MKPLYINTEIYFQNIKIYPHIIIIITEKSVSFAFALNICLMWLDEFEGKAAYINLKAFHDTTDIIEWAWLNIKIKTIWQHPTWITYIFYRIYQLFMLCYVQYLKTGHLILELSECQVTCIEVTGNLLLINLCSDHLSHYLGPII